jgi:hypothetical protein
MANKSTKTGSCLCGAVQYSITGPLRPVVACHCTQCQKTTGHHVAATQAYLKDFQLEESRGLKWYRSSDQAERGFCDECGGNLFWRRHNSDCISIFAGTLDQPTGLRLTEHIFVEDKADYYDISDDLPKHAAFEINVCIDDT